MWNCKLMFGLFGGNMYGLPSGELIPENLVDEKTV